MKKTLLSIFCLFSLAGFATAEDYSLSFDSNKISEYTTTLTATALAAPEFSIEAGTLYNPTKVEITAGKGATIYYTTDGTEPTTESTQYSEAIAINEFDTTTTIKAIAVVDGEQSNVSTASYTLKVAAPTFSVKGGVYEKLTGEDAIAFTCETTNAKIYYNNRGGDPKTEGSKSYGSLSVLSTTTINAVAILKDAKGVEHFSDIASETYYISAIKPFEKVTTFAAGEYLIHANGFAAHTLSETENHGYLPHVEATANGNYIETNEFYAFTFTEVEGGYTIQDTFGRYVYTTGTHNSFNVAKKMPAKGAVWTVVIDDATGEATITNITTNQYIQHSSQNNDYGCYATAQENTYMPSLYKKEEYPTIIVTPENNDTIPAFSKVTITCESGIRYNENDYNYPYYTINLDKSPKEFDDAVILDKNTIELTFDEPIRDYGEYSVTLPASLFILDPDGLAIPSEKAVYTYTVDNPNTLEVIYANPDNGAEVEKSLEYLYFEYNQEIVANAEGAVITNENGEEFPLTVSAIDAWDGQVAKNALCLKTAEPITTAGVYTFVLKKEYAQTAAGVSISNDITYKFTLIEGLKVTDITPVVNAASSTIDEIFIECNQEIACNSESFLVKGEDGTEYNFMQATEESTEFKVHLVAETPISKAGTYSLFIEDYSIVNSEGEFLPAQTFTFTFDGSNITAGIEEVKGENGEVKTIYDLQGRKVASPTKGIYIIDGKKVLVK